MEKQQSSPPSSTSSQLKSCRTRNILYKMNATGHSCKVEDRKSTDLIDKIELES